MLLFVTVLHVILCIFLILIILLQPGKGGDIGAAFGGGSSSSFFGPRGPATLLSRATTGVAVLFMVTSITLSMYSNHSMRSDSNSDASKDEIRQEQLDKKQAEARALDEGTEEAP